MIHRLIQRAPSTFGWAATAICAFIGTYFSGNHTITAGMWAAGGILLLVVGCGYLYKGRHEYNTVMRELDDERFALSMGRRAPWIMLTITEQDGTIHASTLAQLLADTTPQGRDKIWNEPLIAALWYLDPDGTYVKADHGDAS